MTGAPRQPTRKSGRSTQSNHGRGAPVAGLDTGQGSNTLVRWLGAILTPPPRLDETCIRVDPVLCRSQQRPISTSLAGLRRRGSTGMTAVKFYRGSKAVETPARCGAELIGSKVTVVDAGLGNPARGLAGFVEMGRRRVR